MKRTRKHKDDFALKQANRRANEEPARSSLRFAADSSRHAEVRQSASTANLKNKLLPESQRMDLGMLHLEYLSLVNKLSTVSY